MSRNLLVCCDGTWNDAAKTKDRQRSNVWRFFQRAGGIRGETKEYFRGVGTKGPVDHVMGGLFGRGVDQAICAAYGWLVRHYRPGDRLFLVGFSRGAFTVRSLAGLIGCRGLASEHAGLPDKAFVAAIRAEYEDYRRRKRADRKPPPIQFVGVFDTVGKLGVPGQVWLARPWHNAARYEFHDTQIGDHIRHGRQAVALDDRRARFMPTLWTSPGSNAPVYDWTRRGRSVKQLWFSGQHAHVGGGTPRKTTNIALQWMLAEARACGLKMEPGTGEYLETDPLNKLKNGLIPSDLNFQPRPVPLVQEQEVGRTIHASVMKRRKQDPAYWATRILGRGALPCAVKAGTRTAWQAAGIWVERGQRMIAQTDRPLGAARVRGFVANGENPKADGTWSAHESFALNTPHTVQRGGGYVYFRVLRQPGIHRKSRRRRWRTLPITLTAL